MARRLRMTAELGNWLAELSESQPGTAAEVGAALVAVLEAAEPSGLITVCRPGRAAEPVWEDPREIVDYLYQQQLRQTQHARRQVADAASARRAAELAFETQQAAGADAALLAALAERRTSAQLREADLGRVSQVLQAEVDSFRIAKETAKARFTAAEASLRVAEAVQALGGEPDPDLAQRRADYQAAEERLRALRYPGTQTVAVHRHHSPRVRAGQPPAAERSAPAPPTTPTPQPAPEPVAGLLELRADPLGSDIRILFATEPADTMTLLAVLEGPEAVREHGAQAIALAGDLLTEIRGAGWPADIDQVALADTAEFRARFFPADDGGIARRAGVLAVMTPLGRLRADRHLTIDEVAAGSGLSRHRVETIEREGLRTAFVHEAVALARALGARLELTTGSGPVAG